MEEEEEAAMVAVAKPPGLVWVMVSLVGDMDS